MISALSRLRRPVAGGIGALLLGAAALTQGASPAHAGASPLPGVPLPVPAVDVTESDTNLASTAGEVVVATQGSAGPQIIKLRARSAPEAARLAQTLDRLPGVTAARNQTYRVPAEPDPAEAEDSYPEPATASPSGSATTAPRALRIDDEQLGSQQWGLHAIGAEEAWQVTRGAGITIAVVDTGVEASHPDLVGRLLPQINVAPGPNGDVAGHGTHVAGIIAASMNGIGTVGLANQARILPVRVFDASGTGDTASVASGVNAAVRRGVHVINLSLGGPGNDPVLARAIANAHARGVTVVASVGNEGDRDNRTNYPANYPGVIGVGSVDRTLRHSRFSNVGPFVDISAPGEEIYSTYPHRTWEPMNGTSMAAPFVSATAGLVRAANPTLSHTQVAALLYATAADDPSGNGKDPAYGHGWVRAGLATRTAARRPGGIQGPHVAVRALAARGGYGNVLVVNVNPDKPDVRGYAFRLQKRTANGAWVTQPKGYRTDSLAETKSLTMPPGVYRVLVPAASGYSSAVSAPVTLTAPTVRVSASANSARSKLRVDVTPDKGKGYWSFTIQKRTAAGTWATMKKGYRTKGARETRTINLKAGVYRVSVAGKYGLVGTVSAPVTLVR